jgi:hypothetical protein
MIAWRRGDQWYIVSSCERFTVSKSLVRGEAKYSAWKAAGKFPRLLGIYEKPAQAKARCTRERNELDKLEKSRMDDRRQRDAFSHLHD